MGKGASKSRTATDTPLELPCGLRLAWVDRGRELPVAIRAGLPCTAMGEFPKAPRRRRAAEPDAGLFAGVGGRPPTPGPELPTILVYAARTDMDRAYAFAAVLGARGYPAEARREPGGAA